MSRDDFHLLWKSARRGDLPSKSRLYEVLKSSPALQQLSRSMGGYADKQAKARSSQLGKKRLVKDSPWTNARNNLGKEPAKVVSGGLPTLGKRS